MINPTPWTRSKDDWNKDSAGEAVADGSPRRLGTIYRVNISQRRGKGSLQVKRPGEVAGPSILTHFAGPDRDSEHFSLRIGDTPAGPKERPSYRCHETALPNINPDPPISHRHTMRRCDSLRPTHGNSGCPVGECSLGILEVVVEEMAAMVREADGTRSILE